jgi:hypothetical protein
MMRVAVGPFVVVRCPAGSCAKRTLDIIIIISLHVGGAGEGVGEVKVRSTPTGEPLSAHTAK